ncbi:response regulator [Ascidiaceihabitans sp.]|uniref:response regulator transcription factor n=1 Tax=Ascidiaceihabitans sp. TaxID=1872644 RepID=UPI00329A3EA9
MARILVLEDNWVFSNLICASLAEHGHETKACVDASSALAAFKLERFDLVIADIIIRKDGVLVADGGYSLISNIRSIKETQRRYIPIIAISGSVHNEGMQYLLVSAKGLGADVAMAKPFAPHQLIAQIETLLAAAPD